MILFIGLTGGIGAGKSTALEALKRLGAAVLSTDRVVHELYGDDEVKAAVSASGETLRSGTRWYFSGEPSSVWASARA